MDTETMIRNLKCVEEQHKDDKVFTGQLNISQMAHDVRKRLEELKPYEDTGLTPLEIRELKNRDTANAPERAEEQPYFRKHFHTMTCPVCHREIRGPWEFCAYCGQRIKERRAD